MQATYLKSLTDIKDLPVSNRPQIAVIGRSNVGKSSLINHLTQQKNLARVSSESGRTKTINLFEIDKRYFLVDLPGYGFAKASKDKRLAFADIINDYLWQSKQIKLIILIIDARIGPTELDHAMMEQLAPEPYPVIMILNKADKLSRTEITQLSKAIQGEYPGLKLIPHSNLSTMGRGEIVQEIDRVIRKNES
jgi:GTP-binding protein